MSEESMLTNKETVKNQIENSATDTSAAVTCPNTSNIVPFNAETLTSPTTVKSSIDKGPSDNSTTDSDSTDNGPVENGPIDNGPIDNGPVENSPVENSPIENPPTENIPAPNAFVVGESSTQAALEELSSSVEKDAAPLERAASLPDKAFELTEKAAELFTGKAAGLGEKAAGFTEKAAGLTGKAAEFTGKAADYTEKTIKKAASHIKRDEYDELSDEEVPQKRHFHFRKGDKEFFRDKWILSRISDENLMEYLTLEQKRSELQQQAKDMKEKRIFKAFIITIALAAIVAVIYLLRDNPTILVNILYISGIAAVFWFWKKPK